MKKIQSPIIKQLYEDLRFSPKKQKLAQLQAAEKLYCRVDENLEYPYEFICFYITGYRPKIDAEKIVSGQILKEDLQLFIRHLSSSISINVNDTNEKIYTIEQVAEKFNISTRTVDRWRLKGLLAKKYVFPNGTKRTCFTEEHLEKFIEENPKMVKKAERFSHVKDKTKKRIIERAKEIVKTENSPRHETIVKLANETSRSRDTIRRILIEFENSQNGHLIFERPAGVLSTKDEKDIFKMYLEDNDIEKISERFHRSKSSIYRIINKRRLRELKKKKIDYIQNDEFDSENAQEMIMASPLAELAQVDIPEDPENVDPEKIEKYIETVKDIAPLTREHEAELFRRYNFLKHCAKKIIETFDPKNHIKSSDLKQAEDLLAQAEEIRKILIVSNLRLVVSIANRHAGWGTMLVDLISDGNMSLMRAVEKFDYSRGFRFSTYASWAVAKDFARKIPAEAKRPDKPTAFDIEEVQLDFRQKNIKGVQQIEQAHESLEYKIENNLSDREQYIIKNHYGLIATGMKKKYKSLKQIGQEIGLSKERVRQLELIALKKLRQSMSPEEFELFAK